MGSSQAAPLPPPPAVKPRWSEPSFWSWSQAASRETLGSGMRLGRGTGMGAHVCSARVCTSRIVHGYGLRLTSASGSSGRILRRVVLCILGSLSLRGVALCGSWFVACGAVHRTPYTVHRTQGLAIVPRDRFLPSLQIAGYGS